MMGIISQKSMPSHDAHALFLYLCEITNYIKMTTTENIRKELQALVDAKYKEFHSSLLPGANNILGVRIPQLRIMAKEIIKKRTGVRLLSQPIRTITKKQCFRE